MKRSEMLQMIYRMLHCQPDYPTEDQILDEIEAAGMLPPPVTLKIEGKFTSEFFEWEKE